MCVKFFYLKVTNSLVSAPEYNLENIKNTSITKLNIQPPLLTYPSCQIDLVIGVIPQFKHFL